MPKLSIITINLNNLAGLQKTMQSVFAQTFTDYEYIIIDGGSSDGSKEEIKKHESKLVYWVSEKDNGIYEAMNKGIKIAKGEYLQFLNSGDNLYDNQVLAEFIEQDFKEDIVYGKMYLETLKIVRSYPEKINFGYLYHYALPHQSMFFKKGLFEKCGLYDTNYKIVSDWLFYTRAIVQYNASTRYFDRTISHFNEDGLSYLNVEKSSNEKKDGLKKYFGVFIEDYFNQQVAERQIYEYKCSRLVGWVMQMQKSNLYKRIRNISKGVF